MAGGHGWPGVALSVFARPMVLDPTQAKLDVPVLLWESLGQRAPPATVTLPGKAPTRPHPGEPLVFPVCKAPDTMNAVLEVSIGRTPNNDIVIDDESVSRFHAVIGLDEKSGQWSLSDMGSSNGTFVRGERITPEAPFALGDEEALLFGSVSARFLTPHAFFRYLDAIKNSTR